MRALDISPRSVEEITIAYESIEGVLVRRELFKKVLRHARGYCWVVFTYQERNRMRDPWNPPRLALQQWKMVAGRWEKFRHMKFSMDMGPDVMRGLMEAMAAGMQDEEQPEDQVLV